MKNYFTTIYQKLHRYSLILAILFSMISCYTPRETKLLQESNTLPTYEKEDYTLYRIEANDELLFRLMTSNEDFTNLVGSGNAMASSNQKISYRVYPDSTVDLPYINSVKVAGLTLDEASAVIKNQYKEIVPDAEVKLTLANKTYTIIGDAGTGVFPVYKEKLTIYQALAQSGEILLSGDRKHVKIIRETNSNPQILEFDIRPKSIIESKYYYIYPNDIIYVQRTPMSFYKTNNYSSLLGLISSSISLFITAFYFNKTN